MRSYYNLSQSHHRPTSSSKWTRQVGEGNRRPPCFRLFGLSWEGPEVPATLAEPVFLLRKGSSSMEWGEQEGTMFYYYCFPHNSHLLLVPDHFPFSLSDTCPPPSCWPSWSYVFVSSYFLESLLCFPIQPHPPTHDTIKSITTAVENQILVKMHSANKSELAQFLKPFIHGG